ncbi:MAG TPA: aldehyde dehydrogenase family protein [Chloroflexia bacterium]|nr:aldehyde dehydrogenase family protein [Chloroflexia bacterium]
MSIVADGWISGISPLDGRNLEKVRVSSPVEVAAAVEKATQAQEKWAKQPIRERAQIVEKAGCHLMSHADEIAAILHLELGKPLTDTYAVDLGSAPEVFHYYARHAANFLRSETVHFNPVKFPRKHGKIERLPHGVVSLITPWNYPVSIPLHNLVPALIAGNSVILKPSEYAARTTSVLYRLLSEGLPEGLLGLVQGDGATGEALLRADVNYVVFVGGALAGKAVARLAAEKLIPVSLELGGKDAAIVLEDADLDRAANGIAWAGFVNAGQSCAGVERVYVVEAVAEAFKQKLVQVAQSLKVGDDTAAPGSVDIGPLSNPRQFALARDQVNQAVQAGAILDCGGEMRGEGLFYRPAVLSNVNSTMSLMQEETFGPVVPVQVVPDEASAIQEANRTCYGLTGSVWTRDLARGERVAGQLQVGVATVNNHMFSGAAPQAPWMGQANSGYGVQNSKLALLAMTRPRLLVVDAHRTPRELWWLPNDRAMHDLGRGMLLTQGAFKAAPLKWLGLYLKLLRGVAFRLAWQRRRNHPS